MNQNIFKVAKEKKDVFANTKIATVSSFAMTALVLILPYFYEALGVGSEDVLTLAALCLILIGLVLLDLLIIKVKISKSKAIVGIYAAIFCFLAIVNILNVINILP